MTPTTTGLTESLLSFATANNFSLDSLHYVGISLGCFTAMDLSVNGLKPHSMALAAPVPLKSGDGVYAFHNNLEAFEGVTTLVITGSHDEYNQPNEVEEWLGKLTSDSKKLIIYDGGHTPPLSALDSVVNFLNEIE